MWGGGGGGGGTEVGCSWGSDARPSYFNLLNVELCEECSRTLGMDWKAAVNVDAIGKQQPSGHNQGTAAEADPIGEQQLCTLSAQRASCPALEYSRR